MVGGLFRSRPCPLAVVLEQARRVIGVVQLDLGHVDPPRLNIPPDPIRMKDKFFPPGKFDVGDIASVVRDRPP